MSENFNEKSSLWERLKNSKVNRSAVISTCLLLVAVIIITTVAIVSNRSKNNDDVKLPDTTQKPTTDIIPEDPDDNTDKKPDEEQPTVKPDDSAPVEDKLPTFSLPVSGAVLKKHDPTIQVFSNTMNDYRVHLGVDIVTEEAAPVYAAADGKIDKIWVDTLMGYCIAIKHKGDSYTIYKNLAKELPEGIAEGVSVRAGQLIASVGESAMIEIADEPHLHFEMTVSDLSVDPLKYFDEQALSSLGIDASYGE